MIDVIVGGWQD